jgi:hypothetical protein
MLKVEATRTFSSPNTGGHSAGDVFLLEETPEVKKLIAAKLFNVLAVELDTVEPVAPVEGISVGGHEPGVPKKKAKKKASSDV